MLTIKELLSKIRYDSNENPDDYDVFYYDRVKNKNIKIHYTDIKKVHGNMFTIVLNNRTIDIPLHRIRVVERKGESIWKRQNH